MELFTSPFTSGVSCQHDSAADKMVKALTFKGDKKPKKRKRNHHDGDEEEAPASKQLVPSSETVEDDDNWVSAEVLTDITGPVMLVLPTKDPVACLATDSMGKVFASPIENMVENAPSTAEPHLVSQVWVATRVVGSEKEFTLKGHHGRYLGCDKYGICSATREAISPEETLKLSLADGVPGMFDVQTTRGTFISVSEGKEVRGDAEEAGDGSHVRIRMQARFKPKHKVEKEEKVRSKISRKELEEEVGRKLDDDEAKKLKRARKEGTYHEALLDVKVKGKHDKFA